MKTAEEYLVAVRRISERIHRSGEFTLMKEIQPKTIALKCNLAFYEQDEFCREICEDLNIWADPKGDHITLYPQFNPKIMTALQKIVTAVQNSEKIYDKVWITVQERENLADNQIEINIFFPKLISSQSRNFIVEEFQIKAGIGARWLSDESLLIDLSQEKNTKALLAKRGAALSKAESKKAYARECGKLSRLYDVPFVNVLLLGTDPETVKNHANQLRRAGGLIAAQDEPEKRLLFKQLFGKNQSEKRKALQALGISIDNIDPQRLDLNELRKAFD